MGWKVIVSPSACADLQSIVSYIARDNAAAAIRFGDRLIAKAETLSTFPESGRVVREFGRTDIREVVHQNYRIIYRVHTENRAVEIVRFWHGARGTPSL